MPGGTKEKILRAAMRLFGERGYAATTIAAIEEAAGLSPGSGAVYRHFTSKQDILRAGVRAQIEANTALVRQLGRPAAAPGDLRAELTATARAGLRRLEAERDLNRLLLRDLRHHPDLLAQVRDEDLAPVRHALAGWLAIRGGDRVDTPALAAVLAGAVSHYWIFCDVFGEHPSGVSEQRYLAVLVDLVVSLLSR